MLKPLNYYTIVKRDFTKTKNACAVQPAFTDKRNALEAMEDYACGYVANTDGDEYAKRCLIDEALHMSFVAKQFSEQGSERSAKFLENALKERETEMKEKGFSRLDNGVFSPMEGYVLSEKRFLRKVSTFPKKHFITRDPESSTDRLTVWRKYDVTKTVPGRVYGQREVVETLVEKQFSVEVIAIPSSVLFMDHKHPDVLYQAKWYQALFVPKNMTVDQYIEKERKDLAADVSACIKTYDSFTALSKRFEDEEGVILYDSPEPLNLPRLRYDYPGDFTTLPYAQQYVPAEVPAAPVEAPNTPTEVLETPAENTETPAENTDPKDNIM